VCRPSSLGFCLVFWTSTYVEAAVLEIVLLRRTLDQFRTFALFGALGMLIDMGVFMACLTGVNNPYVARTFSFIISVAVMWYIHRTITFRTRGQPGAWRELRRFFIANALAFFPNFAVFALAISASSFVAAIPLLAIVCGAVVGLAVNFLLSLRWTFKSHDAV
jgi:putative flippase GtrA